MDGRISLGFLSLILLCAGCVATQSQKSVATSITPTEETPKVVKKEDGPKRNPKPATEIAYGQLKEGEADSDAGKLNPEAQARLRDEARIAYQRALKLDPNNLDACRHLGQLYAKIGDFERAQETYRQVMVKYPKDASLWYDLGLVHNRRKDFGESLRCFSKALELEPENREFMKKLGFTLAWVGQHDQGLAYLTRAQGPALAHCNLARILDQKNQRELAIQHCRLALRENPQLQDARNLLAQLEGPPTTLGARAQFALPVISE